MKTTKNYSWVAIIIILLYIIVPLIIIKSCNFSQKTTVGESYGAYRSESNNYSSDRQEDYSWIVGTWYCKTSYGTLTVRFAGDGSSGECFEMEDLNAYSVKKGTYYVENNAIHYILNGETGSTYIEIQSGNRLHMGGGNYFKKIQ